MTDLGLMTLFWYWSDFSPASKPRHSQMPWFVKKVVYLHQKRKMKNENIQTSNC